MKIDWKDIILPILSLVISKRDFYGKSVAAIVGVQIIKFVRDSFQLLENGDMTEEELLDYWRASGIKIEDAYDDWKKALSELDDH